MINTHVFSEVKYHAFVLVMSVLSWSCLCLGYLIYLCLDFECFFNFNR